jgi:DHA1 family bicyclomycin/chloramphenicol resistance-like MFS transporter
MAMGILMVLYVHHWGLIVLFLPQAIGSFGAGLMLPTTIAGAASIRPHAAGTASGFAGFAQMGIGAAGAQLSGFVVASSTTALPLMLQMSAIVVLAAAAFMLVRPRELFAGKT